MTTCLAKSCSFGLLCVSCVGICQFVSMLSLLVLRVGSGILTVLVPDHCLSFYFSKKARGKNMYDSGNRLNIFAVAVGGVSYEVG